MIRHIALYARRLTPDTYTIVDGIRYEPEGNLLFRHPCPSEFHGFLDVYINGLIELHPDDSYGEYPILNSDEVFPIRQIDYVEWMYPPEWGMCDTVRYKHIVPNGPNYFIGDEAIFEYDSFPLYFKERQKNISTILL